MPDLPEPEFDDLTRSLQGLASHDEAGLDPAEVWHKGVARRRTRGAVAGALAVAVLAGGAWGLTRGNGPSVVAATPSPSASGPAASSPPTSRTDLVGTSWDLVEVRDAKGTHDVSSATARLRFTSAGSAEGTDGVAPFTSTWGDPVIEPAISGSFTHIAFRDRAFGAVGSTAAADSPVGISRGAMGKVLTAQIVGVGYTDGRLWLRTLDGVSLTFVPSPVPGASPSSGLTIPPASTSAPTPKPLPSSWPTDGMASVTGAWKLVQVRDAKGTHDVSSTTARAELTGTGFQGNDGVNGFTCTWTEHATATPKATALAVIQLKNCVGTATALATPNGNPRTATETAVTALQQSEFVGVSYEGVNLVLSGSDGLKLVYAPA